MVEKERKRQSATVDDDSTEKAKPWYKSRAFLIALSLVVFSVLLSKSSSSAHAYRGRWCTCKSRNFNDSKEIWLHALKKFVKKKTCQQHSTAHSILHAEMATSKGMIWVHSTL